MANVTNLTKSQLRRLAVLHRRLNKVEDRIGQLMSQRADIEDAMAAVYNDPR